MYVNNPHESINYKGWKGIKSYYLNVKDLVTESYYLLSLFQRIEKLEKKTRLPLLNDVNFKLKNTHALIFSMHLQ